MLSFKHIATPLGTRIWSVLKRPLLMDPTRRGTRLCILDITAGMGTTVLWGISGTMGLVTEACTGRIMGGTTEGTPGPTTAAT